MFICLFPVWIKPNFPKGSEEFSKHQFDLLEGVQDKPVRTQSSGLLDQYIRLILTYPVQILNYNPKNAKGGWMNFDDARSRILLHMNWKGQTLPILLGSLPMQSESDPCPSTQSLLNLPQPDAQQVAAI